MTSFHALGNKDDISEQLIMSVRGPRMTGKRCLITRILTLSLPDDLFDGMADMMLLISEQETGPKLKLSFSSGQLLSERIVSEKFRVGGTQ